MRTRTLALTVLLGIVRTGMFAAEPTTFGTTNTVYVTVPEWQFWPSSSSDTYADFGSPARRYATSANAVFFASPPLPSGALLQSVEFDFCNLQPPGGESILLQLLDMSSSNSGLTSLTLIAAIASQGCASAAADLSSLDYTVDNHAHRLLLQAFFGNNADDTTSIAGVIVGYRLAVSPPPGSPTFSDVPASDPAFQYVEALAAAGITGGCGNGNFCPDSDVTRRQMAVFLALALGLYFP